MPFILLAIIAVIIGTATIIESNIGTSFVVSNIYGAIWMKMLWAVMAISSIFLIVRRRLWSRLNIFLLHLSFIVILSGAMLTSLFSEKGVMHLRTENSSSTFITNDNRIIKLPFIIHLDSFAVNYYPGTDAPFDYVSHVSCLTKDSTLISHEKISMNNILRHDGYRFYQTSFDKDGNGSWLTVNHDTWGISTTYCGYVLLALSSILILLQRKGRLYKLANNPLLKKSATIIILMFTALHTRAGLTDTSHIVSRDKANEYRSEQIIYNDRIAPFNTLATDFVTKLYGDRQFMNFSPEQIVMSWQLDAEHWNNVRIIRVKNAELLRILGIESEYASFNELFDNNGEYRLTEIYQEALGTNKKLERAIIETDEKVALVKMLTNGTLFTPLPDNISPAPQIRIKAELLYNSIPFNKILFMTNLALGLVLMAIFLYKPALAHQVFPATSILLMLSTLFLSFAFILRWYISDRIPLSNAYETMTFVALATQTISCLFRNRIPLIVPIGLIISGSTLLVSHLAQMNPQITPLIPVLQSPLLSSHVALIMVSYSLFAFMALNALVALMIMRKPSHQEQAQRLTLINRIMLYPSTLLLAIGIFIGAVWANVSWGSYWSWDPKEVWALVTMITYGIAFHDSSIRWLRTDRNFNIYMALSFLTVVMTYFGVNYLLGGMHSYAN